MLFEVHGNDNKAIMDALEIFNNQAAVEYKEALKKAKQITSTIGYGSVPLPEEWMMAVFEENGKIYIRFPMAIPKIMKIFRRHKVMVKNMKLFLESQGLKCDVKFIDEKT